MYSGDPKTGHLNTGNIRNPDVLDVRISNGKISLDHFSLKLEKMSDNHIKMIEKN